LKKEREEEERLRRLANPPKLQNLFLITKEKKVVKDQQINIPAEKNHEGHLPQIIGKSNP